jgi:hypothetical protein
MPYLKKNTGKFKVEPGDRTMAPLQRGKIDGIKNEPQSPQDAEKNIKKSMNCFACGFWNFI